jgi:glycosyltransferase involved in cell wall biosynthesis
MRAYAAAIGELHIISAAPAGAGQESDGTLYLYPVHGAVLTRLSAMARTARRLVKEKKVEVVSAQDPFEHGLVALAACAWTRAKLHVQVHTDIGSKYFRKESTKNRVRLALAPLVFFMTSGVRVVSERVKRAVLARYGRMVPEPVVIPVAVPGSLPGRAGLPGRAFMFSLIAVSRLAPEKRIEDMLAALVLVRRKYPEVGLYIVGEGSERENLVRRAHELGLWEHVIFLGWRADPAAYTQSARAFLNTSAYEGYGLSIMEAALAGTPIITTDVGVVGDVLMPEEDLLTVPVGDAYALSAAILRLIEKSDLGPTLAISARKKALEHVKVYEDQPALIAADLLATRDSRY